MTSLSLTVARSLPSGLTATPDTQLGESISASTRGSFIRQIRTLPSAVTTRAPSGETHPHLSTYTNVGAIPAATMWRVKGNEPISLL